MKTVSHAFLDGRLQIDQPAKGYRAGADPVFLSAAVPAVSGDRVLELGCGVGTAMLCLLARVPGATVTGVEIDETLASHARQNLSNNDLPGEVVTADIAALPKALTAQQFDHVMLNPPFFNRAEGSASPFPSKERGRGEADFATWIRTALKRTVDGGTITMIHRAERLPDLLPALGKNAGDIQVLPLQPRAGRSAKLIILRGKKGAKSPFRLLSPFVLHLGDRHEKDGDSYTPEAQNILRHGAALLMD